MFAFTIVPLAVAVEIVEFTKSIFSFSKITLSFSSSPDELVPSKTISSKFSTANTG